MSSTNTPSFKLLLEHLPDDLSVLDIGYGGLQGENTTNFLREKFQDITGINNNQYYVDQFIANNDERDTILVQDYWEGVDGTWDLVVQDLNIAGNIACWKDPTHVLKNVEKYYITYLHDGAPYKGLNMPLRFIRAVQEERRPEITWLMFGK